MKSFIEQTLKKEFQIPKLNLIQTKTIPIQLKKHNLIAVSPTGSGKTLAFLIPILEQIDLGRQELQTIIIAPTRELASQIFIELNKFKKNESSLRAQLFTGGNDYEKQLSSLKRQKPQILIATPTRLKTIIGEKAIDFRSVFSICIDEADMLSDLGFANDLNFIITNLLINNSKIQITCWSATLHNLVINKLEKYLDNPKIVKIGNSIYENQKINHSLLINNDYKQALNVLIKNINPYLCIIFANDKNMVEEIYKFLKKNNLNVIMLHANLASRERKNVFSSIKKLNYQYIVASDLASRGIDINGISDVISIGLPENIEWYIHRCGRTGRGKYEGNAWTIIDDKEVNQVQNLIKKGIIFNYFQIKNNKLCKLKNYVFNQHKNQLDDLAKNEIKKFYIQKNKKVKPNYKKKQKEAIQKIIKKSKRRYLDHKMKSIANNK